MGTFVHDLIDPGAHWCPDCGMMRELCTCAPELPFAGYWDWWEDENDDLDDEWDADEEYSYRDYDGEWGIDE